METVSCLEERAREDWLLGWPDQGARGDVGRVGQTAISDVEMKFKIRVNHVYESFRKTYPLQ